MAGFGYAAGTSTTHIEFELQATVSVCAWNDPGLASDVKSARRTGRGTREGGAGRADADAKVLVLRVRHGLAALAHPEGLLVPVQPRTNTDERRIRQQLYRYRCALF